jgi:hypothetical protein
MKNSPSTAILTGVLALCVLASVVLCWFYIHNAGELRSLQGNVVGINNRRAAITALVNDALEFGQKHPDIYPVLQAAGVNPPKSASASTNKPAK